ncbi:hypothetical protein RRG08_060837 [Elysia crispata]|uniref:Uncharacterized protein n=1 Tax=Elysia crispata TaxID=231223 RepID=A0AAE0ZFZ8_9GAST|nr:hypothetical protein RRG08_060837 [Elysia crispata]
MHTVFHLSSSRICVNTEEIFTRVFVVVKLLTLATFSYTAYNHRFLLPVDTLLFWTRENTEREQDTTFSEVDAGVTGDHSIISFTCMLRRTLSRPGVSGTWLQSYRATELLMVQQTQPRSFVVHCEGVNPV